MVLSNDLISQFVKITNDNPKQKKETIAYGTAKKVIDSDGKAVIYVKLDGSDVYTPAISTTELSTVSDDDVKDGDRVMVTIKNHNAIITGNTTSPAASTVYVDSSAEGNIKVFEAVLAKKVDTEVFDAEIARLDKVIAEEIITGELIADVAEIKEDLTAQNAVIETLQTDKLDAKTANSTYATITNLEATNTNVENLTAEHGNFETVTTEKFEAIDATLDELTVEKLDAKYANIDFSNIDELAMENFYANSGLIENVIISDGTIAGRLVGVTIIGDVIEGGTIKADKLVIKGDDGLYYKLNTDGVTTEAEQTEYNSLNGNVFLAKSITASKISVDDLVAFDATIGGFHITDSSIYSEVKDSEDNVTRGIYMDSDGQINFGDSSNYIKYYRDDDGSYKLVISAESILYALNGKQYSIADLGQIGDYVHIGTYENEPCIELGESDSDFKLVITNTRILFMEGSSVPAHVTNQSLHITKAVIEEEIQQGEFVWKIRQNGNMGLMWKGEA